MDTIDNQIVKLLQDNGRLSIKRLAEIICLTPPAVAERIKKLEEAGVILGYRALINPTKLGKNIKAIISVTLDPDKQKEFFDFAKKNNSVLECHHVTGKFSMIIKAVFNEMTDLDKLVGEIQQFGNTQTHIILSSPIENKGIL